MIKKKNYYNNLAKSAMVGLVWLTNNGEELKVKLSPELWVGERMTSSVRGSRMRASGRKEQIIHVGEPEQSQET